MSLCDCNFKIAMLASIDACMRRLFSWRMLTFVRVAIAGLLEVLRISIPCHLSVPFGQLMRSEESCFSSR